MIESQDKLIKDSAIAMIGVWLFFIAFSVIEILQPSLAENQAWFIGTTLISAVLIFAWFLLDARENSFLPSNLMKVSVAAVAFIAVPIYIFKYKGFKKGLISSSKFFAFFAIFVLICFLTEGLMYGFA